MKLSFILCLALTSALPAQSILKDVRYGEAERQVLDIYSPLEAKGLPVVFWIHGGGWQVGDKSEVELKPQFFMDHGMVFVSTNDRLLPHVEVEVIVRAGFTNISPSLR